MCTYILLCAFVTELCVDYHCVPIDVYHHEPSRRTLIELVYVPSLCMHHNIICELFATDMCTTYQDNMYSLLENKFHATPRVTSCMYTTKFET